MAARKSRTRGDTPRREEPLTSLQRAARDGQIVQREAQSWGWKAIAEEAGLSPRRCQEIAKRERGQVSLLRRDPAETMERLLGELERLYTAHLALAADADNSSAGVGALAGAARILDRLIGLLGALHGARGLRVFADSLDLQQVARETTILTVAISRGQAEPRIVETFWRELTGDDLPPVDDEAVRALLDRYGGCNGSSPAAA